jgi:hypothetical protein
MTFEKSKESDSSVNEMYKKAVSRSMYVLPFYILVPVFFGVLFICMVQLSSGKLSV